MPKVGERVCVPLHIRLAHWNVLLTVELESETASAKVWRLYGSKADKYDTELAETWKGQTDAMLIFVSAPYRPSWESLHLSR